MARPNPRYEQLLQEQEELNRISISAVEALKEDKIGRIILVKPVVEAGEKLGFLPGDLNEKIHPYMYPIFDFLSDYLTTKQIEGYMKY